MISQIGNIIEVRRKQLGISREKLALKLGITSQTILNIEKDPDYNLGTKLLKKIEKELRIQFIIKTEEILPMLSMNYGNEEAILYIRKNYPGCTLDNRLLGKLIWEWIKNNANGEKLFNGDQQSCYWGENGDFVNEIRLPKSATQFEINRDALPKLYTYLDYLGNNQFI